MQRLFVSVLLAALLAFGSAAAGAEDASAFDLAQTRDATSAKDAFEAAKELGTVEAWNAYLASFPKGFYADLARAYLKKLDAERDEDAPGDAGAAERQAPPAERPTQPAERRAPPEDEPRPAPRRAEPPAPPAPKRAAQPAPPPAPEAEAPPPEDVPDAGDTAGSPEPEEASPPDEAPQEEPARPQPAKPAPAPAPAKKAAVPTQPPGPDADGGVPPTDPNKAAVARGGRYMGFPERFNRYYTEPNWKPLRTLFVSPTGGGDGSSRASPMAPEDAVRTAGPGTGIVFARGAYRGCYEFTKGGTYDAPIVLFGERNDDGSIGVSMQCCKSGRQTCFNLEAANYVAIDGFEFLGGKYGVRAVGAGYAASEHQRGVAVLRCRGRDQDNDPFFTGQSDWAVFERNVGSGAKKGDGHGIYLSNGSDWNIVRFNETFGNDSSDFQINADPTAACKEAGIEFDDPRCHAFAGVGEGGQGASDYMLVDSNFFHHSLGPGANFASVRRSLVRNNVFGLHRDRHNVSFYNESDSAKLGSSENRIVHNLFITNGRHGVKFDNNSVDNLFENNVVVGVAPVGKPAGNPQALLMEVDEAGATNTFRGNFYASGKFEGREPNDEERYEPQFSATWFKKFPTGVIHDPRDFAPTAAAPYVAKVPRTDDAPTDLVGTARPERATAGPMEPQ